MKIFWQKWKAGSHWIQAQGCQCSTTEWTAQVYQQSLNMCLQNSVSGRLENSLSQEWEQPLSMGSLLTEKKYCNWFLTSSDATYRVAVGCLTEAFSIVHTYSKDWCLSYCCSNSSVIDHWQLKSEQRLLAFKLLPRNIKISCWTYMYFAEFELSQSLYNTADTQQASFLMSCIDRLVVLCVLKFNSCMR